MAASATEPWHGKRVGYIKHRCRCEPCRSAEREYTRARKRANPEHVLRLAAERARRYKERHRDEINARDRAHRAEDPTPFRRKSRRHYQQNRGYYAEKSKQWRINNEAAARAKSRMGWQKWNDSNPEGVRAAKKRWADANREAVREASRRRRARIRSLCILPFGHEELAARLSMWSGCWICGDPPEAVDHVKPCAKAGPHALSNLRPICKPCNSSKSAAWHGAMWAHGLRGKPWVIR